MIPIPHRPRRLAATRRDRGAVIPLVALMLTTLMVGTAFSIDLGRLRVARRDLQADADFLALDAASVLDGLTADAALPLVVAEANASADRNNYTFEPITSQHVELGIWDQNTFTPVVGSQVPNAVRITLTDTIPMYFDLSKAERSVTRTAIGVDDFPICLPFPCTPPTPGVRPASRAELGSVLARLDVYEQPEVDPAVNAAIELQATFMNHLWSRFLGVDVPDGVQLGAGVTGDGDPVTGPATGLRLDAVSYKGLADGMVSIDQIAEQLRVEGILSAGTIDELLLTDIGVSDFLRVAATVLTNSSRAADVDAGSILGQIAAAVDNTLSMRVGNFLEASSGRAGAVETWMNVDDLLLATVSVINGRNFVDVTIPTGDNLEALGVPSTVVARVTVIEPPQWHRGLRYPGDVGPSTSQIRVEMNVPVPDVELNLGFLSPLLSVVTEDGNIPLVMEVAKAESTYLDMACPSSTGPSWTDLEVENSGAEIAFDSDAPGIVATATAPTSLINGVLSLLGGLDLTQATAVDHARTWSEGVQYQGSLSVNAGALGNVETQRHFAPYQSDWLQYPSTSSPMASLAQTFSSVNLDAPTLTSSLDSLLTLEIKNKLGPVVQQLDGIADPLLQAMGVTLAGSDARIQQLLCETVFVA